MATLEVADLIFAAAIVGSGNGGGTRREKEKRTKVLLLVCIRNEYPTPRATTLTSLNALSKNLEQLDTQRHSV